MAKGSKKKTVGRKPRKAASTRRPGRWVAIWLVRAVAGIAMMLAILIVLDRWLNVFPVPYQRGETARLGSVAQTWVPMDNIAPVMARSVVAAEDANFCEHWGVDMKAVRKAIDSGGTRGGSTISQQVVKNVYLWHGRNYFRKALEALITPVVEIAWSKRRILEVYLNVAEFDEGVFGVEAAAVHYFNTHAADLSAVQAARLAAILPSPRSWSASQPTEYVRRRAASVLDGAETIRRDGRAACFED